MTAGPVEPAQLLVRVVGTSDELARPLFEDLAREYGSRYGGTREQIQQELERYPAVEFEEPHGVLLLLLDDGRPVAGGAYRRYDATTAELKRIWTHPGHRRRGLARRVLVELERRAIAVGYDRLHLTTGPRQPEAKHLYLTSGYRPLFDVGLDPESIGPLAFEKDLVQP